MNTVSGLASRHIWLLRHAKATAKVQGDGDHSRALAPRGRSDAKALAGRFAPKGDHLEVPAKHRPSLIICSDARRTVQTVEPLLRVLGEGMTFETSPKLYEASIDTALTLLSEVDDEVHSVMLVGHNPTLSELVYELCDERGRKDKRVGDGMATCGLALIAIKTPSWAQLRPGTGRLTGWFTPPY